MHNLLLIALATGLFGQPAASPTIVSVTRIWDGGAHNAFTDLIRWRDRWYCTFREGDAHVGGDGRIRVLVSTDGERWTSAALVGETGIDLRDPKLSITPDDRLMIVAGGSVYEGKRYLGRQPRVMFSRDGTTWSDPERVLEEGDWLWRVTWHDGRAYGASYKTLPGPSAESALTLVSSADGRTFDRIASLSVPGMPNETTLRLHAGRRDGGAGQARGRRSFCVGRPQPGAIYELDVAGDDAPGRWSEFHPSAGRGIVGIGPQIPWRAYHSHRPNDSRWRVRASAHTAVRW